MAAKGKKLDARPDGSIQWAAFMEKACADFLQNPAPLDPAADFATNQAAHAGHNFYYQFRLPSRMVLLKWHGSEAVDYFLLPRHPNLPPAYTDKEILRVAVNIHDERVVTFLLEGLDLAEVRQALAKLARLWPLYVLGRLLDLNPTRRQPAAAMLWELLAEFPEWLAPLREACTVEQGRVLERLLEVEAATDATPDELPALLTCPPWRGRSPAAEPPELHITGWQQPAQIHWTPEARAVMPPSRKEAETWVRNTARSYSEYLYDGSRGPIAGWPVEEQALYMLQVGLGHLAEVVASRHLEPGMLHGSYLYGHETHAFFAIGEDLAAQVLQVHGQAVFAAFNCDSAREAWWGMLRRQPQEVITALARHLPKLASSRLMHLIGMIESDEFAVPLATMLGNKWARAEVRKWLDSYPATAARGLLPVAFGPASKEREAARTALRWLAASGHAEALRTAAVALGQGTQAALAPLLDVPQEAVLPEVLPELPRNLYLPMLPRLIQRGSGHAVPLAMVADALMPCMLTRLGEPYVGLSVLQECLTTESLARFGQVLFKWWQDNGMVPKERWMFDIQGFVGNDETARLLTVALRAWRAGLDRVRAYDGMQMLVQIGSDIALMHLNALAVQTRYNDLHERATGMIDEVAEQRELTREELADRTVPDLGLDESGKLALDFGPRQFVLEFDSTLTPVIKDADGKRLKTLPAPNAKDDATLAKEASAAFKEIKKQVKTIATNQLKRLEQAMCRQRRWSLEEFTRFFVQHPLLGHYARSLTWGGYAADGSLLAAWRVAEDLTLADADDELYVPPAEVRVGILHRLDAPAERIGAFAQVFADYRILAPFPQLDREVYLPDAAHAEGRELPEWVGRKVTIGSLMGLEQRGWIRSVGEGGMVDTFSRTLADGIDIYLHFSGEWFVGDTPDVKAVMTIESACACACAGGEDFRFSHISAVAFSEMQRDLHLMAWFE